MKPTKFWAEKQPLCCSSIHGCLEARQGCRTRVGLRAGLISREAHRPCSHGCSATAGAVVALGTPLELLQPSVMPGSSSPSCQGQFTHHWDLSSLFSYTMTTFVVCLSLSGQRSVMFLKAVNQVRNNSFSLARCVMGDTLEKGACKVT